MPHTPIVLAVLLATASGCWGPERSDEARADDIAVVVRSVGMDERLSPVVILGEQTGVRSLRIWIGLAEARSIAVGIQDGEREATRPNSHDLADRVIRSLDAEVVRIVVTELRRGTYYALLSLRSNGDIVEIDSRPSDAIAIALRTRAPIFVREPLFESAAHDSNGAASRQEI